MTTRETTGANSKWFPARFSILAFAVAATLPSTQVFGATAFTEDFSSLTSGPNMTLGTSPGTGSFASANFTATGGRIYLGTNDTDYSSVDFVFSGEVTTGTSNNSNSNVYFGMGNADASSTANPTFGLPFTVPNLFTQLEEGVNRLDSSDNQASAFTLNVEGSADWGGGTQTHYLQLTWTAATGMGLFEIDRLNDGSVDFSFTLDGSDNGFDATNSALFVGGNDSATWDNISVTFAGSSASSAPEPSTFTLALLGLVGVGVRRRRRR